jgi:hypothetical protein
MKAQERFILRDLIALKLVKKMEPQKNASGNHCLKYLK